MATGEKEGSSFARWWEFYAVRYAIGTVVGSIIFFYLCYHTKELHPLLFHAVYGEIDTVLLILMAGYGFAFCYFSSAPILIFHVARFLFLSDASGSASYDNSPDGGSGGKTRCRAHRIRMCCFGIAVVYPYKGTLRLKVKNCLLLCKRFKDFSLFFLLPMFLFGMLYSFATVPQGNSERAFYILSMSVFSLFVFLQFLAAFKVWRNINKFHDFYAKLSVAREGASKGYVESYRHLREHGNAFFIIFMEIVLACAFYSVGRFSLTIFGMEVMAVNRVIPGYMLLAFLWVLPSFVVWMIGSYLERRLVYSRQ